MVSRDRMGGRAGVVLVDVIIGTVILSIALSVILSLASNALSTQANGRRMTIASMLLDERLNLVLAFGADDYGKRFETRGPCDNPFEAYAFELEFEDGKGGDPYLVRATISWQEGDRERSIACETMIAPRLGDDPDPDRRPAESEGRPS